MIRQEYLTPSLTLLDSKGHASAAGRPNFLQLPPTSSTPEPSEPILGGFILPSWRQDAHQDAKLGQKFGFKSLLNPSWTHLAPNIAQHRHQDGTTTPSKTPKIIKNLKENHKFLLFHPCPRMSPKSSPRPPKSPPKSTSLGPRCPQDFPSSAQDAHLDAIMEHLGPNLEPCWP